MFLELINSQKIKFEKDFVNISKSLKVHDAYIIIKIYTYTHKYTHISKLIILLQSFKVTKKSFLWGWVCGNNNMIYLCFL